MSEWARSIERLSETGLSVRMADNGRGYLAIWPDGHVERFSAPRPDPIPDLADLSSPEWNAAMLDECHAYWLKAPKMVAH